MPHEQLAPTSTRRPVDLDVICRWALGSASVGDPARLLYRPRWHLDRDGLWDPAAIAGVLSLLLDEALADSAPDGRVELSFHVHLHGAVVRIHHARPCGPGDRLVTFFEADEDPRRWPEGVRAARDELIRQQGTLARVRTGRGTTWVVSLPRGGAAPRVERPRPALRLVTSR